MTIRPFPVTLATVVVGFIAVIIVGKITAPDQLMAKEPDMAYTLLGITSCIEGNLKICAGSTKTPSDYPAEALRHIINMQFPLRGDIALPRRSNTQGKP